MFKKSANVDFLFNYINNNYAMKKKLSSLTENQASMLLAGIISGVIILGSLVGLIFGLPGLLIGAVIGTIIEMLYLWLVGLGATFALKESKTGLFFLVYGLRIVAFVGTFALLVVLQYVVKVQVFFYSCWTMLGAFAPATFITIAVQLMHKER